MEYETFELKGPPGRVAVDFPNVRSYLKKGFTFMEGEEGRYNAALQRQEAEMSATAEPAVAEPGPMPRPRRSRFQQE